MGYQVIARRYRPKSFQEVLGQDPIVTTLKNGMKQGRLAHAYLFSGPRGTGKTTLARLLAKAINCLDPSPSFDPCNRCSSCSEIASGSSLDVIEIDGASHRGIEDIRQINETAGYSTASGKYKIYIIDEVHMLTKEAFNALLKTLEEPPPTVKFFFATTEPHKIPPTVLSRCQQFSLRHLKTSTIVHKLSLIAKDQQREVEEDALMLVAKKAEGGLRDAESLFDQLLSFYDGKITAAHAADSLGMLPQEIFFKLDIAAKEGHLHFAFDVANHLFNEGKDPACFIQTLTEHYRTLLVIKLAGPNSTCLELSSELKTLYIRSADYYQKNQLLTILELCLEASQPVRLALSPRVALEGLLLKILRSSTSVPVSQLVERLLDLESRVQTLPEKVEIAPPPPVQPAIFTISPDSAERDKLKRSGLNEEVAVQPISQSITEDPTPKPSELPKAAALPIEKKKDQSETVSTSQTPLSIPRAETLLQFAAVELEGRIIKK